MGSKPPLYNFVAFAPPRVALVRADRELAWVRALAPKPTKKRSTSAKPKSAPKPLVGVPPEFQALAQAALRNLGM